MMFMKYLFQVTALAFLISMFSCTSYEPSDYLNEKELKERLVSVSYYTEKKPKDVSYQERFNSKYRPYYERISEKLNSKFSLYYKKDSLHYFLLIKDEPKSLYADQRAVGGIFRMDKDSISMMDIKFITPMGKKDEILKKSREMFDAMVNKTFDSYFGDPRYMEWPNQDVVYDTQSNRWVFPAGSSYKVFEKVMTNQK